VIAVQLLAEARVVVALEDTERAGVEDVELGGGTERRADRTTTFSRYRPGATMI
jgi:hypothetical protein